ncbi:methyl-accepting chemotaxis protein [Oxalobacteraceae bacterium A2-2]
MLKSIFRPGTRVMRRLRMPSKFALIIVTLLIPLFMLTYLYVAKTNADLEFVANERAGVEQFHAIGKVAELSLRHRGNTLLPLMGLGPDGGQDGSGAALDAALDGLEQALAKDDPFQLAGQLRQIRQDWRQTGSASYTAVEQVTASYGKLDAAIAAFEAQVDERSQLALDPDVASYYLMIAGTDKLPALVTHLAPLRGLAAYAAARPEELGPLRLRMAGFITLVESASTDAQAAIARAGAARPDLVARIDARRFASIERYLARIRRDIMSGNSNEARSLFDDADAALADVVKLRDTALAALDAELAERQQDLRNDRLRMLLGVSAALAVAAYCLVSFFLSAQSGFRTIAERVERLSRGDLVPPSAASGTDEISESLNRFGTGVGALAVIVQGVRVSAESIGHATAEIAAGNSDLAARGSRIAGTVQQTAASMQALAGQVTSNQASAHQATELSAQALQAAESGAAIATQAMEKMNEITASSRLIGEITEVINGIAFQTNILALNAAVEAARAGEQGRGFAVVASEVRNLAQRCAVAAKEIGDLIKTSIGSVEHGARFVNQAGGAMGDIMQSVRQLSDIVGQISAASSVQSEQIRSLAGAVAEVDASTQENAAMVEEIAAAVMALDERASFLSDSVKSFKTGAAAPGHEHEARAAAQAPRLLNA